MPYIVYSTVNASLKYPIDEETLILNGTVLFILNLSINMKAKKIDAVEMKRRLQKESEQKLSTLSEKEQLELLAKKFGHIRKPKKVAHVA